MILHDVWQLDLDFFSKRTILLSISSVPQHDTCPVIQLRTMATAANVMNNPGL